jgi:hypothetical protein
MRQTMRSDRIELWLGLDIGLSFALGRMAAACRHLVGITHPMGHY